MKIHVIKGQVFNLLTKSITIATTVTFKMFSEPEFVLAMFGKYYEYQLSKVQLNLVTKF